MKKVFLLLTVFLSLQYLVAQQFLAPSKRFSKTKISYITLNDDTILNGKVEKIYRKKGKITKIDIIEETSEEIRSLEAKDIKYMYLMPNGLDKLRKTHDITHNVSKWGDKELNPNYIHEGYVCFETTDVQLKKGKKTLLMQLINPTTSGNVKIYDDPWAIKSSSGIGGITVSSSILSYYILKSEDKVATRLKKKHYKKKFDDIWNKCDKLKSEYSRKKWKNIHEHVAFYDKCL
ncbi:MAG: hypothetical protein HRT66_05295 [Flavobacteriaceae bacterium]|nr:hypothetical protein [Flavobacteriaceae bacterium]